MRFSSWYPASQIAENAPPAPGVFQVRAAELQHYPTGKSAMVHYGADDHDLRRAVQGWSQAFVQEQWLYRHATDLGRARPSEALRVLLRRFQGRFGSPPRPTL